jgi:hypothetical protein
VCLERMTTDTKRLAEGALEAALEGESLIQDLWMADRLQPSEYKRLIRTVLELKWYATNAVVGRKA